MENYVKRLIGLPGETIKIVDGHIYIKANGELDFQKVPQTRIENFNDKELDYNFPRFLENEYEVLNGRIDKFYDENSEKLQKRKKQQEYQEMLRQQIASGGGGVDKNVTSMTQGERALNQEKLQKIHNDPELMNTLLNRIKYGSPKKKKNTNEYDDEEDF